jgi:NAD(P)-dependent dehydrogenase (short-subunit alcohol dehydrogenase family)
VPRTIVITGTSGGFGKLCVERSAKGWNVVATVRKNTDPTAHLSKTRKARS